MKACARFFAFLGCLLLTQPTFAEQGLDGDSLRALVANRVNLILTERGQGASGSISVDATP